MIYRKRKMRGANVIIVQLTIYIHLLQIISKNTAKKHYNIIFSNFHNKIHNIFEFERNIGI